MPFFFFNNKKVHRSKSLHAADRKMHLELSYAMMVKPWMKFIQRGEEKCNVFPNKTGRISGRYRRQIWDRQLFTTEHSSRCTEQNTTDSTWIDCAECLWILGEHPYQVTFNLVIKHCLKHSSKRTATLWALQSPYCKYKLKLHEKTTPGISSSLSMLTLCYSCA